MDWDRVTADDKMCIATIDGLHRREGLPVAANDGSVEPQNTKLMFCVRIALVAANYDLFRYTTTREQHHVLVDYYSQQCRPVPRSDQLLWPTPPAPVARSDRRLWPKPPACGML